MENSTKMDAGFIKNIVVVAASKKSAINKAILKTKRDLERQKNIGVIYSELEFEVSQANPTCKLWKYYFPDGFVFFPIE